MTREQEFYLEKIINNDEISNKVRNFYSVANLLCPEKIEDFFVNQQDIDDEIIFYSAWFFSQSFVMEFNLKSGAVDIAATKDSITRIEFSSIERDYNLTNFDSNSKLTMNFQNKYLIGGNFLSVGKNCEQLVNVYNNFFKKWFSANFPSKESRDE
jgi:hypothetical protein